jgi:hypothetical protein
MFRTMAIAATLTGLLFYWCRARPLVKTGTD